MSVPPHPLPTPTLVPSSLPPPTPTLSHPPLTSQPPSLHRNSSSSSATPSSALSSFSVSPTVSNLPYLQSLLQLGRIWHRPLVIRVTITPPSIPDAPAADLSFHAVKRAQSASFSPLAESPPLEANTDLSGTIYAACRYLAVEQDQSRLFGSCAQPTLRQKVDVLLATFAAGHPVHLYLRDLAAAERLQCPGHHILQIALRQIASLAARFSPRKANPIPNIYHVEVVHGRARVDTDTYGLSKISFQNDDDVDGTLSGASADLLHRVSLECNGAPVQGNTSSLLRGVYAWEWPVSELARGREAHRAIPYYARLAAAAMKTAAERTKACLVNLQVQQADWLCFVAEYVGKEQAVYFAAVEGEGGVQRGVRDLSWSKWSGEGEVSIAATVGALRNAGRLGFEDNLLKGINGGGNRVVISSEGGLVTVEQEGDATAEKLPEDALVR